MSRKDPPAAASQSPLGRKVDLPATVDASVLFPIPRSDARKPLGLDAGALPFTGADIWNAWELSWLDVHGTPRIAVAELRVPCDSPRMVESKSMKLYLGGFAMTRWDHPQDVRARIGDDLSACVGAPVEVRLVEPADFAQVAVTDFAGESLDDRQLEISGFAAPDAGNLRCRAGARPVEEALVSRLFRSLCPVTGQPDWASVQIRYRGVPIERAGLLRYLVSWREHADFHESCVERMFCDIQQQCRPMALMVYARFLRRGGIDINPWRATPGFATMLANLRDARQ